MDPDLVNLAPESPDSVCGVLRKWLRTLPEPLFSYEFYDAWVALQHHHVNEDLFGDIQNLMFQLHPTHYLVMQRVFRFLHKLASYGAVNRLTASVLGFHWQPCLLWSQHAAAALDAMKVGPDGGMTGSIVTTMIENYDKLFLEDSMWAPPEFDHVLPPTTISNLTSQQMGSFGSAAAASSSPSPSPTNTIISATPHADSVIMSSSSASLSRSDDDSVADGAQSGFSSSSSIPSYANSQQYHHQQQQQQQQTQPQGYPQPAALPTSSATPPPSSSLPPITIPPTAFHFQSTSNSVPVTPITPLVPPSTAQPLARSFAGAPPTSSSSNNTTNSGSPSNASPQFSRTSSSNSLGDSASSARKKQSIIVNGYIQATAICDFADWTDGMLQFSKNEQLYVTQKHDDGWWEGWKRGRRGFFPAQYVVEMTI